MDVTSVVYCVVPVYNRLEFTRRFLEYINEQDYPSVRVIIVDDGSTDGTRDYLAQVLRPSLKILNGDGNLWWSGAMRLGMSYVMGVAKASDYLLMINNDVRIERDYISTLVRESIANGAAVVGSSQRDNVSGSLLSSGWFIDFWAMRFFTMDDREQKITVNALPGRGVLFPMQAVFQAGNVNARLFPHYYADMEYTARVAELGWKILISKAANVFSSSEPSDMQVRARGMLSKYFSFRSKHNLLHKILLFSVRGPLVLRILAIPRFPFALLVNYIRRFYGR